MKAEGLAREIEALAEATAVSIEKVADALSQPMGVEAMRLRLGKNILANSKVLHVKKTTLFYLKIFPITIR